MIPGYPDKHGDFTMKVGIPSALPYVIQASTNLMDWQPIFTNEVPGWLNFTDYCSTNYPCAFIACPGRRRLNLRNYLRREWSVGAFRMHVDGTAGQPWAIQISADLVNWTSVFTNQSGGRWILLMLAPQIRPAGLPGRAHPSGAARLHGA